MAYYNCLLLDSDNTLLDFNTSQHKALIETLERFQLPSDHETQETFLRIEESCWQAFNRGEVKKDRMLVNRFVRFLKQIGRQSDPVELNRCYLSRLADHADVFPGVLEMLEEVSEVATLAVISNGVERVQMNRLKASGIDRYLDEVFISEKMGTAKPAARFFEMALEDLGIENRAKVLVVGDDLEADIKGGMEAGLDTCWLNWQQIENNTGIEPKYTIHSFEELYPIVMEAEELQNLGQKNRKHSTDLV